jgi:hypothetical protein
VGDTITVALSFDGSVESSDEDDHVEQLRDGRMVLVGESQPSKGTEAGWIVEAGNVEFGYPYRGKQVPGRVRCEGTLWEERHGSPGGGPAVGHVTGSVIAMVWHKAFYEKSGSGEYERVGYEDGKKIYNTNKYPGYPPPDDPKRAEFREAVRSGKVNGPFTFTSVSMDDYVPSGWAFEFTIELPN